MSDYLRSQLLDAVALAWLNVIETNTEFGMDPDREDVSSQRDHLLRCAMDIVWTLRALDEQTPFTEITLTGAADEGLKNTGQLNSYHYMTVRLAAALERVMGQQVRRVRALGVPWNKIGSACGMTAQGIYKKAKQNGWTGADDSDPELEA